MRVLFAACLLLILRMPVYAQKKTAGSAQPPVTVSADIDHNRVIIPVDVQLPDGSRETLRAWIDNGNPDLYMSRRLATVLGLNVTCGDKECSAPAPKEILIGDMSISLAEVKEAKIPMRPVSAGAILAPGMNADINIPSTILRHYDVLVDFPERKVSIGPPHSIRFQGSSAKVQISAENGLIQVPGQIEKKKYNLALDLGSCVSFLSEDLFSKLLGAHADWPHMTGAVGPANVWGGDEESKWQLMRVDRVQYGPLFLTNVPFVALSKDPRLENGAMGLIGSEVLLNYRVGLDYARSMVYFEIGRLFNFPDFDVIGLVLRPELDGGYTILGVAHVGGKPSVEGIQAGDHLEAVNDIPVHGATMGQVWSLLGGAPGQEKKLTIERAGKQVTVVGKVQHYLAQAADEDDRKKR